MTDRTRATLLRTRRALVAAGALFATLFMLLALQLWLGRDPALGDGTARAAKSHEQTDTHASVWDTVVGVAAGVLSDDGEHSSSQSPALQSRSS